jgi:NADH-quinone oxidoreductase subunit C
VIIADMMSILLTANPNPIEMGYTLDGTPYIRISSVEYRHTVEKLRELEAGFVYLAVIQWRGVYEILVSFYKMGLGKGFLSTILPEDDAVIESITDLYPAAYLYENEAYEMFGIEFRGHPGLRRIFTGPEDGHPFRKDHSLAETPPGGWVISEK